MSNKGVHGKENVWNGVKREKTFFAKWCLVIPNFSASFLFKFLQYSKIMKDTKTSLTTDLRQLISVRKQSN